MGVDVSIRTALFDRLALLSYPVAWENVSFTPADVYLDAKLFRNTTTRIFITDGEKHRRLGFLQVAVMAKEGVGSVAADEIAEEVQAHFPDGARYGPVRITQTPSISDGFPDGGWRRVPVTVFWESHN